MIVIAVFQLGVLCTTGVFYVSHKMSGLQYEESQCVYYITSSMVTFSFAMVIGFTPFFAMIFYYVKLVQMSRYDPRDSGRREEEVEADASSGGGCCCFGCACGFVVLSCQRDNRSRGSEVAIELKEPATAVASGSSRLSSSASASAASRTLITKSESQTSTDAGGKQEHSRSSLMRMRMRKQSRKARQLIRLIVYAYCCCVLPPYFVYLIFTFGKSFQIEKTLWFYSYILLLRVCSCRTIFTSVPS